MAFPLNILTELMIDGAWTDVSGDVYNREAMQITHGRADEAGRADASRLSFTLNNRDGKYSPRNPRSPLYGKIGRNTPVRVSVFGGESYVELDGNPANNVSTPDHASMHPTTSLDIRAEVSMDWRKEGGNQTIIGKWDETGDQRSWVMRVSYDTVSNTHTHALSWTTGGTFATQRQAWINIRNPLPRYAIRVRLDLTTGDLVFYAARSLAGPWIERARQSTGTAETIYDSTAPLRIGVHETQSNPDRVPFTGYGHRFEVLVDGAVVASPDFRAVAPGSTSFADSAGRTWTLNGSAAIKNRHTRFEGEISSWPSRWDVSGNDVWVPIQAAGIRRRLGQGPKALDSTLRRRVPSGKPLAYWPCEEGAGTTRSYSPIPNVKPLRALGAEFAADDSLGGSGPLPKFTGPTGQFTADVPYTRNTGWHVEMPFFIPALPAAEKEFFRVRVTNAGTAGAGSNPGVVAVVARVSTAGIRIAAVNDENQQLVGFTYTEPQAISNFTGKWNRLQLFTAQDGGTTYLNLRWIDIQNAGYSLARTAMNGSPGRVTQVIVNSGPGIPEVSFGHLGVFDTPGSVAAGGAIGTTMPGSTIYNNADDGFINESVTDRMERICREEGVPYKIAGIEGIFTMGPQRPRTLLELLDSAADVDGGMVYDSREGRAIEYRSRSMQYNQLPRLVLNYASGREVAPPLEPVEDDQGLRNDITRTRTGGASYRAVLEDGPLSIQPPPLGVGVYDESLEVNVYKDDDLRDMVGTALHVGTWDEARYPVVNVRLHGAPHLIGDVLNVELLDRIDITNPPEWLPPGTIRLMVQGYTELLSLATWDVSFNCSPYGPWEVGAVETEGYDRADTEGSSLVRSATDSATVMYVVTSEGPEWINTAQHGSEFPFEVLVGGEEVRVSGITGHTESYFGTNVSGGWGSPTIGPFAWGVGGGTVGTDYAVTGGFGTHTLNTVSVSRRSYVNLTGDTTWKGDVDVVTDLQVSAVATGGSIWGGLAARYLSSDSLYQARLAFQTGNALQLTIIKRVAGVETNIAAYNVPFTYTANTSYRLRFRAFGSDLRAKVWPATEGEPVNWQLRVTDTDLTSGDLVGCRSILAAGNTNVAPVVRYDNFKILNPQRFTLSARSLNGVVKSHAVGADVRLTRPVHTSY